MFSSIALKLLLAFALLALVIITWPKKRLHDEPRMKFDMKDLWHQICEQQAKKDQEKNSQKK